MVRKLLLIVAFILVGIGGYIYAISSKRASFENREADLAIREQVAPNLAAEVSELKSVIAAKESSEAQRSQADQRRITELTAERDARTKEVSELKSVIAAKESSEAQRSQADQRRITELTAERDARTKEVSDKTPVPRTVWGAISYSSNGAMYGSANALSEHDAVTTSLALCIYKSRDSNCKIERTFSNGCLSLARVASRSPGNAIGVYNVSSNWQFSEQTAVSECERRFRSRCELKFTTCSPDTLSDQSRD